MTGKTVAAAPPSEESENNNKNVAWNPKEYAWKVRQRMQQKEAINSKQNSTTMQVPPKLFPVVTMEEDDDDESYENESNAPQIPTTPAVLTPRNAYPIGDEWEMLQHYLQTPHTHQKKEAAATKEESGFLSPTPVGVASPYPIGILRRSTEDGKEIRHALTKTSSASSSSSGRHIDRVDSFDEDSLFLKEQEQDHQNVVDTQDLLLQAEWMATPAGAPAAANLSSATISVGEGDPTISIDSGIILTTSSSLTASSQDENDQDASSLLEESWTKRPPNMESNVPTVEERPSLAKMVLDALDQEEEDHNQEAKHLVIETNEEEGHAPQEPSSTTSSSSSSKVVQFASHLPQELRQQLLTPHGQNLVHPDQSPLLTLLQRNQTLVQEVRFADQTCVELSAHNQALQDEVASLKEQLKLAHSNRPPVQDTTHNKDETIRRLTMELQETKSSLATWRDQSVDGDTIKGVLHDIQLELGALSQGHVLDESVAEYKQAAGTNALATALQEQVAMLKQKAHMAEMAHAELQSQLEDSRNALAKEQVDRAVEASMWQRQQEQFQERILSLQSNQVTQDKAQDQIQALQEALESTRDNLVAMKRHAERLAAQGQDTTSKQRQAVGQLLQTAMAELSSRYQQLAQQVVETTSVFEDRLVRLTQTVCVLKENIVVVDEEEDDGGEDDVTSTKTIPTATPAKSVSRQHLTPADESFVQGKVLTWMEEARSPSTLHAPSPPAPSKTPGSAVSTSNSTSFLSADGSWADLSRLLDVTPVEQSLLDGLAAIQHAELHAPLQAALAECRRVQQRIQPVLEERQQLIQQLQSLQVQQERLESENANLCLQMSRDKLDHEKMQATSKHLHEQVSSLQQELSLVTKEKKVSDQKLSDLQNQWTQAQQERQQAAKATESLQAKHYQLESKLALVEAERDGFAHQLSHLKNELSKKQEKVATLQDQLEQAKAHTTKLIQQETDLLKKALQQAEMEVVQATNELSKAQDQSKKNQSQIKDLQTRLSALQQEKNRMATKAEDDVLRAQMTVESLRQERSELAASQTLLQDQVASLTASKERLLSKVQDCEQALMATHQKYKQELSELQSSVQAAQDHLSTQQTQTSQLARSLNAKEKECKNLQTDRSKLQDTVRQLQDRQRQLVAQVDLLKTHEDDMFVDLKQAKDTIQDLQQQLEATIRQRDVLQEQQASTASLQQDHEALQATCDRLRQYVRKLTTKCEEWSRCYDQQTTVIQRLQRQKQSLQTKAAAVAQRYQQLHHQDRAQWSAERSDLHRVHTLLESELGSIAKELDGWELMGSGSD